MAQKRKSAAELRCPRCGSYPCRCPKPQSIPPQQQNPRIFREKERARRENRHRDP
jgi:hypothetical protein